MSLSVSPPQLHYRTNKNKEKASNYPHLFLQNKNALYFFTFGYVLFKGLFLFMCEGVCSVFVCAPCTCLVLEGSREGHHGPWKKSVNTHAAAGSCPPVLCKNNRGPGQRTDLSTPEVCTSYAYRPVVQ